MIKHKTKVTELHDKKLIEAHFRKNIDLNLYQIGDLDGFFWKYTNWYGLIINDEIKQIILLYSGTELPVLLALCDNGPDEMKFLLNEIKQYLSKKFYSHVSNGLEKALSTDHYFFHHGTYTKMTLNKNDLNLLEDNDIKRLSDSDLEIIKEFYKISYPDNWFDKRMLETGKYFGYFTKGKLTGISGIHVYSPEYKVAVLGNITTLPYYRGISICAKVTSVLCKDLFENVDNIGLNVHCENKSAIKSYERVGFKITGNYEEFMFEKK